MAGRRERFGGEPSGEPEWMREVGRGGDPTNQGEEQELRSVTQSSAGGKGEAACEGNCSAGQNPSSQVSRSRRITTDLDSFEGGRLGGSSFGPTPFHLASQGQPAFDRSSLNPTASGSAEIVGDGIDSAPGRDSSVLQPARLAYEALSATGVQVTLEEVAALMRQAIAKVNRRRG
jgi:hypothetical protein